MSWGCRMRVSVRLSVINVTGNLDEVKEDVQVWWCCRRRSRLPRSAGKVPTSRPRYSYDWPSPFLKGPRYLWAEIEPHLNCTEMNFETQTTDAGGPLVPLTILRTHVVMEELRTVDHNHFTNAGRLPAGQVVPHPRAHWRAQGKSNGNTRGRCEAIIQRFFRCDAEEMILTLIKLNWIGLKVR